MNSLKNILPFTLVVIAMASCKVGQNYNRPEIDFPDQYYGADSLRDSLMTGKKNMAAVNWKAYFKDSTLVSLIDSALSNNFDMQKMTKEIDIGYQNLQQSKANFLPSLGASPFKYNREYYSEYYNNYGSNRARRNHGEDIPTSLYTERMEYVSSLQASWEIDIWGKLRWQKEAARADFMKTQEFKKALQTALVSEVATTYLNMLMLKSQLTVSRRNYELSKNTLRIVKLQYDAGETTSLAVQQTESQMLRAKALIPDLERDYAIQETRLNELLGRAPQELELVHHLEDIAFDSTYQTGVPLELIQNRPDIAASEYNLIISNANVGVTQAMKYPSLTISGGVGLNSYQIEHFLDPMGAGFALLNGAIFQPIFQNRKLKTNHLIALNKREIAQLDFKETIIGAVGEVSNALVTIEKLQEAHNIVEDRLQVTNKGIKDAFLLFQSGFASYLEIINAQEDALENQMELVRLKTQLAIANIELYRSLGGGWK
ncbi:efflux transporter outer membrane subunit [Echinicola vietnamensis]|uniref:Efflux transporter, outer membrane factor lipoprotein, NodT family n=1 Tax=Echinicola vietnamensis (strain DSM 17526 / LMG 23754 / KMM 6221) TaxID=926556 RepID=L0G097_ECHVK|nr:efflux transporter outer membrane subunit [Echinicola vietnamensis]AGA78718.1 efflux transporter, outer membrane factor lipoprotein, NodT family [Echinicola vietnamensis DSM 17526]